HARAVSRFRRESGLPDEAFADDLLGSLGHTGAAHFGLLLADALDRAAAGDLIALTVLADGATTVVLRVLAPAPQRPTVHEQAARSADVPYPASLTWRGRLDREPPRRPDPAAPAAPPAQRNEPWKFGFVAAECGVCGTRHLPPSRACLHCGAADRMAPVPM